MGGHEQQARPLCRLPRCHFISHRTARQRHPPRPRPHLAVAAEHGAAVAQVGHGQHLLRPSLPSASPWVQQQHGGGGAGGGAGPGGVHAHARQARRPGRVLLRAEGRVGVGQRARQRGGGAAAAAQPRRQVRPQLLLQVLGCGGAAVAIKHAHGGAAGGARRGAGVVQHHHSILHRVAPPRGEERSHLHPRLCRATLLRRRRRLLGAARQPAGGSPRGAAARAAAGGAGRCRAAAGGAAAGGAAGRKVGISHVLIPRIAGGRGPQRPLRRRQQAVGRGPRGGHRGRRRRAVDRRCACVRRRLRRLRRLPAALHPRPPTCAPSTSRTICASAVSAPTRATRTRSGPPTFTVPPITASPGPLATGAARHRAGPASR